MIGQTPENCGGGCVTLGQKCVTLGQNGRPPWGWLAASQPAVGGRLAGCPKVDGLARGRLETTPGTPH